MCKRLLPSLFCLLLSLFVAVTVYANNLPSVMRDVYLEDGAKPVTRHKTNASTVAAFLKEINVVLYEKDETSAPLLAPIKDEMKLIISRSRPVVIMLDGTPVTIRAREDESIGSVIADLKEKTGIQYLYDGLPNAFVTKGSKFELVSERYDIVSQMFLVPYEVYVYDLADLPEGHEEIANQGDPGLREIIYRVRYVGGREVAREVMAINVLSEPQAHVVFRGASPDDEDNGSVFSFVPSQTDEQFITIDGERVEYITMFEMNSSAYTAASTGRSASNKYYGITATGIKAERGIVAVDPEVIPMGAKLYIEGYGYATAADTGPSIKGNKIDLYYDTLAEAKQYGRKSVAVYMIQLP